MAGVLVFGEATQGKLIGITAELLGAAKRLDQDVSVVLAGQGLGSAPQEAIAAGANRVYTADNPALTNYLTETYVAVAEAVCKQTSPDIVLMGQTALGRDLAPRLAFRLGVGAAMDCIKLEVRREGLVATRPVYGGNALAEVGFSGKPQIATVRAKTQEPLAKDAARKGEVVALNVTLPATKVTYGQLVRQEAAGIRLEDAEVVVGGGRGVGSADGFKMLEELAKLLKGAVGSTRAAVDNGWRPSEEQIGLTGKIVAPSLYIAVGLSGSSQHLAGCAGSKTIVAINKDPEANIFKAAQLGVVGDYKQVLPAFLQEAKKLMAG